MHKLFFIISIVSLIDVNSKGTDISKTDALDSLQWIDKIKEGGIYISDTSTSISRSKRFIPIGKYQPNNKYQACEAPGGGPGFCRHLHYCILDEIRKSFTTFMSYFCMIDGMFVGICCPELSTNATTKIQESDKLISANNSLNELDINIDTRSNGESVDPEALGCGVSLKSRGRIIGGRPADPKEWPWMAALLRNRYSPFCGGVLITDRHVLSAAHCTINFKVHEIRVRLGEYDFTRTDDKNSRDFRVVDIRQHAQYSAASYVNDISILKLHISTSFNSDIWPICLPSLNEDLTNKYAVVTGWGTQGYAQPVSDVLMEVEVPIWSHSRCEAAYETLIPDIAICAGGYNGGKDSCQGDSGGPLMYQGTNRRWTAVGIVSFGVRCGEKNHPGIYTKVNKYLPWIVENSVF